MNQTTLFAIYGAPPAQLVSAPAEAVQLSPLVPGATALEEVAAGSVSAMVVAAPPGTLERRYVLAQALRMLSVGAGLTVLAPKDKGGARLKKELESFGCPVTETGRAHHRICITARPSAPQGLEAAIASGGPQFVEALGLWSQPGLFSWDRPDPGSQLLASAWGTLNGRGADLGCGAGWLARAALEQPGIERLELIDLDRRAIAVVTRNIKDPRARLHWADVRLDPPLEGLDFVITNPPFHDAGAEDKALGQAFIRRAHGALRRGGRLWLVANRHLPYEAVLTEAFAQTTLRGEGGGFKVYEARK